jgi:hypothetical protein
VGAETKEFVNKIFSQREGVLSFFKGKQPLLSIILLMLVRWVFEVGIWS